jgi:hypothetical protein
MQSATTTVFLQLCFKLFTQRGGPGGLDFQLPLDGCHHLPATAFVVRHVRVEGAKTLPVEQGIDIIEVEKTLGRLKEGQALGDHLSGNALPYLSLPNSRTPALLQFLGLLEAPVGHRAPGGASVEGLVGAGPDQAEPAHGHEGRPG